MTDNLYPTNRGWCLFDPEIHPPPAGANLLLINEGGKLIIGPWYKGALAWGHFPIIPATVKARLTQKQQQQREINDASEPKIWPLDPR